MGLKEDEFIYVLIRVPKSASTSLMDMFSKAYPNSQSFSIPAPPRLSENDSLLEKIRVTKNYKLSLFKNYRCFSEECVWEKVESALKPNDIVSGHFTIDEIKINKYQNRLITLIRNPVDRVISDYNYNRLGYAKRNILQKAYNRNKLMAAGKYNLEGYLSYMQEHYDDYGSYMKNYILGKDFSGNGLDFMLKNYFSFGTVERIDRFISDFKKKTGIELHEEASNQTKHRKIDRISASELELIEKICGADIDLYRKIDNFLESQRS